MNTTHNAKVQISTDSTHQQIPKNFLNSSRVKTQSQPAYWPEGVPNSIRSATLCYCPRGTICVVELVNTAQCVGLLHGDDFTFRDVEVANQKLSFHISDDTLRKILNNGIYFAKLETILGVSVSKNDQKIPRGCPLIHYRIRSEAEIRQILLDYAHPRIIEKAHPVTNTGFALPFITEEMIRDLVVADTRAYSIANELNDALCFEFEAREEDEQDREDWACYTTHTLIDALHDPESTPLPCGWPLSNQSRFAAAYANAFFTAHPGLQISRRRIESTFGVCNGSLDGLIFGAGLRKEERYKSGDITNSAKVAAQVASLTRQFKGFPRTLTIRYGEEESPYPYNKDAVKRIEQALESRAKVQVHFQQANRYYVANTVPVGHKPVVTHCREHQSRSNTQANPRQSTKHLIGPTFDPHWFCGHLLRVLERMDWLRDGDYLINPETGEKLALTASPTELVEAVLGHPI